MNQKIKISQLPAKGSNLAAQDLLEVAEFTGTGYVSKSITGQEVIDAAVGNVDWGDIGGTLSAQTDLQSALNAKQNTLSLTTTGDNGASTLVGSTLNVPNYSLSGLGGVPTSRTLTINGVTQDLSANRTFTISTGITIGSTAIASGVVGRVLFEGAGNVVQESSSLSWDATNEIFNVVGRINAKSTTAQPSSLIVEGTTGVNSGNAGFVVKTGTGYQATFFAADNLSGQGVAGLGIFSGNATPFGLQTGAPNGAFFIHNNGNVGIGTNYTNAGFKLDVNGTARVQTSLEVAGASGVTFGGGASVLSYSGAILNIGNSATWTDVRLFAGGVQKYSQTSSLTTIANTTINLATATVQLAGVNALTYSGTDIRIGSVAAGFNSLSMYVSGSERARIFSTGNVGINITTDAGFRLDVNGTARVSGQLTLSSINSTTVGGDIVFNNRIAFNTFAPATGGTITLDNGSRMSFAAGGPQSSFTRITLTTLLQNNSVGAVQSGGFRDNITVNLTGTANETYVSYLASPTLTSIGSGSYIGFSWTNNTGWGLYGSGTALNYLNGNLLIGTTTDVASSILTLASTTKGFLPPRMTTTQRNAIASPAAGLMVYDTTLNVITYYNGTMWI